MAEISIHRRRRNYYILWCALLVLSLGALGLWETPRAVEQASLQVRVRLMDAPPGTRLQAWAGPQRAWPGAGWQGEGAVEAPQVLADGRFQLPLVHMRIARRRWVDDYLPRGTWDLMVLKFSPPGAPPRWFALPFGKDIRSGLLKPRYRLATDIDVSWANLQVDAPVPNRVP